MPTSHRQQLLSLVLPEIVIKNEWIQGCFVIGFFHPWNLSIAQKFLCSGKRFFRMFFTLRKKCSLKNRSLKGALGNQKWFFYGITVQPPFGTFTFKSVVTITVSMVLVWTMVNHCKRSLVFLITHFSLITDCVFFERFSVLLVHTLQKQKITLVNTTKCLYFMWMCVNVQYQHAHKHTHKHTCLLRFIGVLF